MPAPITTSIITVRDSLLSGFTAFMNFVPALLGALLVLAIGWMVSGFVAKLVHRGLAATGLDRLAQRSGLPGMVSRPGGDWTASRIISVLSKWFIFLIFIQASANILSMPQITGIVNEIILFLPRIAVAALILIVGFSVANFLTGVVSATFTRLGAGNVARLSVVTRYSILGVAVIAALSQLGIAPVIVNTLFIGLVASIALAIGLAFGLGGRDVAADITRSWYRGSDQGVTRMSSRLPDTSSKLPPTGTL